LRRFLIGRSKKILARPVITLLHFRRIETPRFSCGWATEGFLAANRSFGSNSGGSKSGGFFSSTCQGGLSVRASGVASATANSTAHWLYRRGDLRSLARHKNILPNLEFSRAGSRPRLRGDSLSGRGQANALLFCSARGVLQPGLSILSDFVAKTTYHRS
jgi:hypothetical protein